MGELSASFLTILCIVFQALLCTVLLCSSIDNKSFKAIIDDPNRMMLNVF